VDLLWKADNSKGLRPMVSSGGRQPVFTKVISILGGKHPLDGPLNRYD
jgi:hypothetical protein